MNVNGPWLPGFLSNLGAEIAVAIVAFGGGYFFNRIRDWKRNRKFDSFWGYASRNPKQDAFVVMSVYSDPRPNNTNRYFKRLPNGQTVHLVGGQQVGSAAEAAAAAYLISAFSKHRSQPVTVLSDDGITGNWIGTFLCLGSGYSNYRSREILSLTENSFCDFHAGQIHSKWDGQQYNIIQNPPTDRALIVKLPNPYAEGHSLVVCAGLAERGTTGAAYYLAQNWDKLRQRYKDRAFGLILEVDWSSDHTAREIASSPQT